MDLLDSALFALAALASAGLGRAVAGYGGAAMLAAAGVGFVAAVAGAFGAAAWDLPALVSMPGRFSFAADWALVTAALAGTTTALGVRRLAADPAPARRPAPRSRRASLAVDRADLASSQG